MREQWSFWIILLLFIGQIITVFIRAAGYKINITWDNNLTGRLTGIILCIIFGIIYAIALGWL